MSRKLNSVLIGVVTLAFSGVLAWRYVQRLASSDPLETSAMSEVRGEGFVVPVPDGLRVVTDPRVVSSLARGAVLLSSRGGELRVAIVGDASSLDGNIANIAGCERQGREALGVGLAWWGIVEHPYGRTCAFEGHADGNWVRGVFVYQGPALWFVSCLATDRHPTWRKKARAACDTLASTWRASPQGSRRIGQADWSVRVPADMIETPTSAGAQRVRLVRPDATAMVDIAPLPAVAVGDEGGPLGPCRRLQASGGAVFAEPSTVDGAFGEACRVGYSVEDGAEEHVAVVTRRGERVWWLRCVVEGGPERDRAEVRAQAQALCDAVLPGWRFNPSAPVR